MMNKNDILLYIKSLLGYPAVDIEIDDITIMTLIDSATVKALSVNCTTHLMEVPNRPSQPLEVNEVIRVYDNVNSIDNFDDSILFSSHLMVNKGGMNTNVLKDLYVANAYLNVLRNSKRPTFIFKDNVLYLDGYKGTTLTIEVLKENITFSDLSANYVDWVARYSLALCKEALGRIRGKYKSNNGPFEMDADALLSEAQQEQEQCLSELKDNGQGFYFVDSDF